MVRPVRKEEFAYFKSMMKISWNDRGKFYIIKSLPSNDKVGDGKP